MDIAKALGNISLFYTDEREVNFCTRRAMGECVRLAASIKIIIFFNSAQREDVYFLHAEPMFTGRELER
jgi:hypothetical protein